MTSKDIDEFRFWIKELGEDIRLLKEDIESLGNLLKAANDTLNKMEIEND